MKTTYLIFACIFTFAFSTTAQVTPIPPKTNYSGNKHTSITTTISNSTSVSNSDDSYKFTSKFQRSKRIKIQKLLTKRLKEYGLKVSGKNYIWSEERNGSLVFECKLTNKSMKMFLYKNEVSRSVYKKIKEIGEELQKLITKHSNVSYRHSNVNEARENVRRAARELERAKEKLRRAERNNK
jgi:hypothetical protein